MGGLIATVVPPTSSTLAMQLPFCDLRKAIDPLQTSLGIL
jgi:hypothetical protein